MRKVVWHVLTSLDGFIAGHDDAMDWILAFRGDSPTRDEVIRSTGAILTGRRMFDKTPDPHPAPYGGAWAGPIFVLTHRPADDPRYTFLTGDLRQAVATALDAAGGKDLVLFGASVARQCLQQGLVDEIVIHLAPILLGDGIRLFDNPTGEPITLQRIACAESDHLTDLRFRPIDSRRTS